MRTSRLLKERLHHRVIVTLKNGQSFQGVLWSCDPQAWVLRDAEALGVAENNTNLPVDGEVILLVSEIAYAQKP